MSRCASSVCSLFKTLFAISFGDLRLRTGVTRGPTAWSYRHETEGAMVVRAVIPHIPVFQEADATFPKRDKSKMLCNGVVVSSCFDYIYLYKRIRHVRLYIGKETSRTEELKSRIEDIKGSDNSWCSDSESTISETSLVKREKG